MSSRIIFHIDVNSAYLSWTAVNLLQLGKSTIDIREVPSIIGGKTEERHGIVLAKSIPAKKFKIKTGESTYEALRKCPKLLIYPPDYGLYMQSSNAMYKLLCEYSPKIQRFSVDEVFIDVSHYKENYMEKAVEIQSRIRNELGFNVNIGISTNKLLAKMASDFNPKNSIHTLFENEIKKKMWHLPVEEIFMVGRATKKKLEKLNVETIGELATYNVEILKSTFKSFGIVLHNYANGIDSSEIRSTSYINMKGLGNSTTIPWDVTKREEALRIILSLVEMMSLRLRKCNSLCRVVVISIKSNAFEKYSHQRKMENYTDCTIDIYREIVKAFDEAWSNEPIRQIGVRVTDLYSNEFFQTSLFDGERIDKQRALDKTLDSLRSRFGSKSVVRSTFINSGISPLSGGNGEEDYLMMSSIL